MAHAQEATIIEIAKQNPDEQERRMPCPFCSHTRRKKTDPCLAVRREGNNAVYHCWHCSESGSVRLKHQEPKLVASKLSAVGTKFLQERGISPTTARKMGVFSTRKWVAGLEQECLAFPYRDERGYAYAVKYRALAKKSFTQSEGGAKDFWGIWNIEEGEPLVIVEGEMDALACMEAGVSNVLSVPAGAPISVREGRIDPAEDKAFGYVWRAKSIIEKCPKVIIFHDDDDPGWALGEELSRRIGKGKCFRVHPDGAKDADDVLLKRGTSGITDLIAAAKPWPVSGLFSADHYEGEVEKLYTKGHGRGLSTKFKSVDDLFTIVPGQVSIVTGEPGGGKSEFVDQLAVNLAVSAGWKFAVCSFENPPPDHIVKLSEKFIQKPFYNNFEHHRKSQKVARMTKEEWAKALAWVNEHFAFIEQTDEEPTTIDMILDRARAAVMRLGVRGVVIDPYNYIEFDDGGKETDRINAMLNKLRTFAVLNGCHVWLVAHPQKIYRNEGGRRPIPTGYDISGGAHWFNKADVGFTVHQPSADEQQSGSPQVEIHCWKVRWKWVGRKGVVPLKYDILTGEYGEMLYDQNEIFAAF
jgi:twinkle protein